MKTDYLYALENLLPIKRLRRAIICLTYRCNSKCKTCTIWKMNYKDQLSLEDLKKFADTKTFKKLKFITLTGGEPFLRKDIDEIVNYFKEKNPKLHLTIITNALLPDLIYEKVKNMPRDVLITFSFNGPEKYHDNTRGVKGNFKKLLKTIEYMKGLGQNMNLIYTVTKENYNQLIWSWEFAKKNDLNIMFSPEMEYERLGVESGRSLTSRQKKEVIEQLKKIYSERHRGFFDYTYLLFFKKFYSNKSITNTCYSGTNSFYVHYNGDVYPCENLVGRIKPFGNLKTGVSMPKSFIKDVRKIKCYENCYMLCEMVPNLRKNPIKTFIERNK